MRVSTRDMGTHQKSRCLLYVLPFCTCHLLYFCSKRTPYTHKLACKVYRSRSTCSLTTGCKYAFGETALEGLQKGLTLHAGALVLHRYPKFRLPRFIFKDDLHKSKTLALVCCLAHVLLMSKQEQKGTKSLTAEVHCKTSASGGSMKRPLFWSISLSRIEDFSPAQG